MLAQGKDFVMNECAEPGPEKCQCNSLPAVDFSTFMISLYSSALVQLGEMPDPSTGSRSKNLSVARQTIDMIDMLAQKTHGNLDSEEEKLMKSLNHELKLAYVKAKC
ncbi:conserved hypothetical protein [Desulfamplus magnetovallimortis]|uniref:DUF1844 domain-containing protein n=1 Tax=Desulfamplus magnetovallimortis TaxID=1246637 RepID=A0A1W1H9B9_9BACT|nr:DUF1844 domain-containing protein [Desulfamplus magnetovallimortis]SLM29039.1 conserved hypothetical protein [Desulfamplus magnetovallimortis]